MNFMYLLNFSTEQGQTVSTFLPIQVKRARHAEHWWRSKYELINDILLWTTTNGHTSVNQLVKTNIYQLCVNIGCRLDD